MHDVEHTHLNFSRKVRQFVDGKQPAVSAGQQAVMHGHFAGKIVPAAGGNFAGLPLSAGSTDGTGTNDLSGTTPVDSTTLNADTFTLSESGGPTGRDDGLCR